MAEQVLAGVPAAPGLATGAVEHWPTPLVADASSVGADDRPQALSAALAALQGAADEMAGLAEALESDREILEAGVLMAADPSLQASVRRLVLDTGLPAAAALLAAAEEQALRLDALDDELLAARASDVRSIGRRAARIAAGGGRPTGGGPRVIVAADLGPADVAELGAGLRAIALAGGGPTGHAAIVARSLGVPMVVGLGDAVLEVPEGAELVVDGDTGTAVRDPGAARLETAQAASMTRARDRQLAASRSGLPAITLDGARVTVLANAASALEVRGAIAAGADGLGLVRTELSFLEGTAWPSALDHQLLLEPILAPLGDRPATVRLLDFGGDKTPPFLRQADGRGIDLLLRHPLALDSQLSALVAAARGSEVRILIPMVVEAAQVRAVRQSAVRIAAGRGVPVPLIGAMIEVPGAVSMIDQLVREVDFLSIGTNDLTALQLGLDRSRPGPAPAHHPAVLRLVAATCAAARIAGIGVSVCGEAASDPVAMPLLLGLGVDTLSVGSSRVGQVREWVRAVDLAAARSIAAQALQLESAAAVEELTAPLRSVLLAS
jgi:phosphoenolpyruvate-protein kinase (PTS system EI component)